MVRLVPLRDEKQRITARPYYEIEKAFRSAFCPGTPAVFWTFALDHKRRHLAVFLIHRFAATVVLYI